MVTAIPEVKRVIVAYNDRIAYEETLAEALVSLFGKNESGDGISSSTSSESSSQLTKSELITKANEAFSNAQSAMQSGNWSKYGEYLNQLESYLKQLAE